MDSSRPGRDGVVRQQILAGDASQRRYTRLSSRDGDTVVECRYPPGSAAAIARDVAARRWFAAIGIGVPRVVEVDAAADRVVIEDLGDDDASASLRAAATARDRVEIGWRLLGPLAVLARLETESLPSWNPPLDAELLRTELGGFEEWYLQRWRSLEPDRNVASWLDDLAADVGAHPTVVCHRDYHLNNLWLDPGGAVRVIDEQDARVGPDSYDAVSLLYERDAVTLLSEHVRRELLARFGAHAGIGPGFAERAAAARLQRGLKVLGTFARLAAEGRGRYREWMTSHARALIDPLKTAAAPAQLVRTLLE